MNIANKKYYEKNKEAIFQYHYNRIASDPVFKMKTRMRTRLYNFLKSRGCTKKVGFKEYIGCTLEELKGHIESQFKKGMNWKNYGEWHVDHISPLSLAKTEKKIYELFHYSNLQPLWASDNIKKGNKIII